MAGHDSRPGKAESTMSRRKLLQAVIAILAVAFIAIQFVPVDRTNPAVQAGESINAPEPVMRVLRASCFDCHSNQTHWPWYSSIAPASWLVSADVREGRDEFNFSHWGRYSSQQRAEIARESVEEVEEGEMPMLIYVLLHPSAHISDDERDILRQWAGSLDPSSRSDEHDQDD